MPGVIVEDCIKLSSIPEDIVKKLEMLEDEMQNKSLTGKDYCDKKWMLLKPHVQTTIVDQIQQLQADLESTNIMENDYCSEMMNILQLNLHVHSPVKFSGSPRTYGRASRNLRSKPLFEADDQIAGPSKTPSSAAKKLAAFKASPRNGSSPKETKTRNEANKRKSTDDFADPNPGTSRTSAKKLILDKDDIDLNGSSPKGPGRRLAKTNRQKSVQQNSISSWIKKSEASLTNSNSKINKSVKTKKNMDADPDSVKMEENVETNSVCKVEELVTVEQNVEANTDCKVEESVTVEQKVETDCKIDESVEVNLKIEANSDSNADEEHNTKDVDEDKDENVHPGKKVKLEESEEVKKENMSPGSEATEKVKKVGPAKCDICRQLLLDSDLRLYVGHPRDAVDEYIALTDPKLSLFTGEEGCINEYDERPQNKITQFSVYDKAGHLCPFDGGLIERNVLLYFSGYVKAVYEESPEPEGGIPAKDMGPINEWWVSGYDGGERALIGFSTAYGEYYLMEPSEAYAPLMESVKERIYMGKLVIEFLLEEEDASYEDLLNKLQTTVPPFGTSTLTEDSLLRHAQFVCDQVLSFDTGSDSTDDLLITSPCMRALVKLAGVTVRPCAISSSGTNSGRNLAGVIQGKLVLTGRSVTMMSPLAKPCRMTPVAGAAVLPFCRLTLRMLIAVSGVSAAGSCADRDRFRFPRSRLMCTDSVAITAPLYWASDTVGTDNGVSTDFSPLPFLSATTGDFGGGSIFSEMFFRFSSSSNCTHFFAGDFVPKSPPFPFSGFSELIPALTNYIIGTNPTVCIVSKAQISQVNKDQTHIIFPSLKTA
uniref:RFTS domain-containing protein n=1 Tax=Graphocephala atropunctata TaxID=36148 RepID=A0A1B6LRH7_9HEMI